MLSHRLVHLIELLAIRIGLLHEGFDQLDELVGRRILGLLGERLDLGRIGAGELRPDSLLGILPTPAGCLVWWYTLVGRSPASG